MSASVIRDGNAGAFCIYTMNKYQIAGRELMKGNIGNAITSIAYKSSTSELVQPSVWRNGNFFFGVNGADKAFIWGNLNSSLLAYQKCPVVASIINKKAKCTVNGKRKIYDLNNKEATSVQAKAVAKLLDKPNYIQSGIQFRAQGKIYMQIYGYCPVLIVKPVGFEDDYTKWKLWNIPPWMLQIRDKTDRMFYESGNDQNPFLSIILTYMGHSITLDPSAIFFIRENQISTGTYMFNQNQANVSLFLPDSRLFTLEGPIDNLIASLNSRGSITRNRGPQWLLTNDANDSGDAGLFPIDSDTKKELHTDFLQYGIMDGQRKAIITDAKLKLQTVGFDVAQLKLLEGEVQDAKHICDGLDYPPYLMGLVDAKFDNQDIAERALYTNSIIPDACSEDEQMAQLLGLEKIGLKIFSDYSHLPALQENITEKGKGIQAMNQGMLIAFLNNIITWNDWRVALTMDTVAGMDLYYKDLLDQKWVFGVVPNLPMPTDNQTTINNNG